jgi:competence protein ComEA
MRKKTIFGLFISTVFCVSCAFADADVSASSVTTGATSIHKVHASKKGEKQSTIVVNVNTADIATLTTLKGIGAKKAQAILDYRNQHGEFKDVHDLQNVKGFSEKTLTRILNNNPNRLVLK